MRTVLPRTKKPKPAIQDAVAVASSLGELHSRAGIPLLEPFESDSAIDIPVSRIDRNDPELGAAFGTLAAHVCNDEQKLGGKIARLAVAYYDVIRLRFDARLARICANAAIQLALDDRDRLSSMSDDDASRDAAHIWHLPPLKKPVRDYLREQIRAMPKMIFAHEKGGRAKGRRDSPDVPRQLERAKLAQIQVDQMTYQVVRELRRQGVRRATAKNIDATALATFDPHGEASSNKAKSELYDSVAKKTGKSREAVKRAKNRMFARGRARRSPKRKGS